MRNHRTTGHGTNTEPTHTQQDSTNPARADTSERNTNERNTNEQTQASGAGTTQPGCDGEAGLLPKEWTAQGWLMHSQVAAGHFTKVWLSRRCSGEAACAVKVVNVHYSAEILRRRQSCVGVTDEAVILATLSHPNTIRMLEWRFTPHTLSLSID